MVGHTHSEKTCTVMAKFRKVWPGVCSKRKATLPSSAGAHSRVLWQMQCVCAKTWTTDCTSASVSCVSMSGTWLMNLKRGWKWRGGAAASGEHGDGTANRLRKGVLKAQSQGHRSTAHRDTALWRAAVPCGAMLWCKVFLCRAVHCVVVQCRVAVTAEHDRPEAVCSGCKRLAEVQGSLSTFKRFPR